MKVIFDKNEADFSGMLMFDFSSSSSTEVQKLYVSEVLHKAYIKVDEQGSGGGVANAGNLCSFMFSYNNTHTLIILPFS